jgi:predicted RNA-binding protein with PIN domain
VKIVFVDGYNVLNNWPELKTEKEYSFQGSRQKLIDIMHNYSSYNNCKVILVFDGYKVTGNLEGREVINKNLTIIFTKDGETADSYIEKEVNNLGRRYEIYVVTSDSLEQQTIFQRGANRMSAVEFHSEVTRMEHEIKRLENNRPSQNNHIQDNVDSNILKKLEEIRRSR